MGYLTLSAFRAILVLLSVAAVATCSPHLAGRGGCPKGSQLPAGAISPYSLVQIAKSQPNQAFGESFTASVTPNDVCTIFDLEIPDSVDGVPTLLKICNLYFTLPSSAASSFSGPGHFSFTGYLTGFGADDSTTYNHQPLLGPSPPFPPSVMVPGNTYTVATLPCGILPGSGGQTVSGALCSKDTKMGFHQTSPSGDGGCPTGFFVVIS